MSSNEHPAFKYYFPINIDEIFNINDDINNVVNNIVNININGESNIRLNNTLFKKPSKKQKEVKSNRYIIMVPSNKIYNLLNDSGKNIKLIRNQTKSKIKISNRIRNSRKVEISGLNTDMAKKMILEYINK